LLATVALAAAAELVMAQQAFLVKATTAETVTEVLLRLAAVAVVLVVLAVTLRQILVAQAAQQARTITQVQLFPIQVAAAVAETPQAEQQVRTRATVAVTLLGQTQLPIVAAVVVAAAMAKTAATADLVESSYVGSLQMQLD
jgi:acetaldehyde dehydrogenase (acetylating)